MNWCSWGLPGGGECGKPAWQKVGKWWYCDRHAECWSSPDALDAELEREEEADAD